MFKKYQVLGQRGLLFILKLNLLLSLGNWLNIRKLLHLKRKIDKQKENIDQERDRETETQRNRGTVRQRDREEKVSD
jgi:hypothetical protein